MPSYLDGTFLGDIGDDMGDDLGAENATMALTPAPGELAPLEYVRLPGGIITLPSPISSTAITFYSPAINMSLDYMAVGNYLT